MIQCKSCGATHPQGTLFCDECGMRLLRAETSDQNKKDVKQADAAPVPMRLSFYSGDNNRQFECQLVTELLVGRSDVRAGVRAEIDLTRLKGVFQGVSRRHARLIRSGQQVRLEDLGSANGTFVMGERLTAHNPREIRTGDELRFGAVVLRIQIDLG